MEGPVETYAEVVGVGFEGSVVLHQGQVDPARVPKTLGQAAEDGPFGFGRAFGVVSPPRRAALPRRSRTGASSRKRPVRTSAAGDVFEVAVELAHADPQEARVTNGSGFSGARARALSHCAAASAKRSCQ